MIKSFFKLQPKPLTEPTTISEQSIGCASIFVRVSTGESVSSFVISNRFFNFNLVLLQCSERIFAIARFSVASSGSTEGEIYIKNIN